MSTLGLLWRMNYYRSLHRLIRRGRFLHINCTPHDSQIFFFGVGGRVKGGRKRSVHHLVNSIFSAGADLTARRGRERKSAVLLEL